MAEARSAVSVVRRLAEPATKPEILKAYAKLLVIWDPKDFGGGPDGKLMEDVWFDIHCQALDKFPLEAIKLAIDRWIAVGKFFPKPAEIAELAKLEAVEIKMMAHRLQRAVQAGETRAVPERTEEDKAQVKAMIEEMRGADGRITLGPPPARPTPLHNQHQMAEALRRLDARK